MSLLFAFHEAMDLMGCCLIHWKSVLLCGLRVNKNALRLAHEDKVKWCSDSDGFEFRDCFAACWDLNDMELLHEGMGLDSMFPAVTDAFGL